MCPEGTAGGPGAAGCFGVMDQPSPPLAGSDGVSCPDGGSPTSMAGRRATAPFRGVGIDVGSVSVKLCGLADGAVLSTVVAHEGDIESALDRAFANLPFDSEAAPPAVVTGGAGRHRLDVTDVIASSAVEAALEALDMHPRAVVSLGGEDLVVYLLDGRGRVQTTILRQQVRVRHGRVLPPAARADEPPPRGSRRGGRRRAGAEALGALLGLHEVRLHAPPEQGRSHERRHGAVALQGDGRQSR